MRMRKPNFESKFQFDKQNGFIYLFAYNVLISFRNSKGQKSYRKFLGVRSEFLLSIVYYRKAHFTVRDFNEYISKP